MSRLKLFVAGVSVLVCAVVVMALAVVWAPRDAIDLPPLGESPGAGESSGFLTFVANAGEADETVLFRSLGSRSSLFFTRNQVVLLLSRAQAELASFGPAGQGVFNLAAPAQTTALRLSFEGANPDVRIEGDEELPGVVNYYAGNDPEQWRDGLPTYGRIVYRDLYPGIALIYSGEQGLLKGTYVVAPGARAADIRWRYDGATTVHVDAASGDLIVAIAGSGDSATMIERKPVAWQVADGKRGAVGVRYIVRQDGSLGFAVGKYDAKRPLMIDPTLDYGTYVGGSSAEAAYGIAVDASNNTYIAGRTRSANYPRSGLQAMEADFSIFVTKLDPSRSGASQLIYTTIISGSGFETAHGIGVDANGNAYVGGYTASSNFPTTPNAYQTVYRGGNDGVVIKLNPSGALAYSSFLGGTGWEDLIRVTVDNGLMYVTGDTTSANFPTTANAYRRTLPGGCDVFVSVFDPTQSGAASLVYSTIYGGSGSDEGWGIAAKNGIIYFGGNTTSANLPLKNPLYPTYRGPNAWGDAYVVKLDPSRPVVTDQIVFATYLGGTGDEIVGGVAVDNSGNIYLAGATRSTNCPTTTVSLPYAGGQFDAFLARIDPSGPSLVYSILIGGIGNDGVRGLAVDAAGNAYVAGGTGSNNFPTVHPVQAVWGGGGGGYAGLGPGDVMIARFNSLGQMTFGTYLGGSTDEGALDLALAPNGRIYVAGGTNSTNFDLANPFQATWAGNWDAFVAGVSDAPPGTPTITATPSRTSTPSATPSRTTTRTPTSTMTGTPTRTGTVTSTPTRTNTPKTRTYLPIILNAFAGGD